MVDGLGQGWGPQTLGNWNFFGGNRKVTRERILGEGCGWVCIFKGSLW